MMKSFYTVVMALAVSVVVGCGGNKNEENPTPHQGVTTDIIADEHKDIEYGELSDTRCLDRKFVKALTLSKEVRVWEITFPTGSRMRFMERYSCEPPRTLNLYLGTIEVPSGQFVTVDFKGQQVKLSNLLEKIGSTLYGDIHEDIVLNGRQFSKGDRISITTIRF